MHAQTLKKIRDFADAAHGPQLRKYTGERYINHPQRVMATLENYLNDLPSLAAALLHDVLEDTETTRQDILAFLRELMGNARSEETLKLVEELTDVYEKKNYPQWNRKKRKQMEAARLAGISAKAQTIKYADMLDNTQDILAHDPGFGRAYARECLMFLQKMTRGNAALRKKTMEVVESGLAR